MFAGLEHHLGRAQNRLRRQGLCDVTREACRAHKGGMLLRGRQSLSHSPFPRQPWLLPRERCCPKAAVDHVASFNLMNPTPCQDPVLQPDEPHTLSFNLMNPTPSLPRPCRRSAMASVTLMTPPLPSLTKPGPTPSYPP